MNDNTKCISHDWRPVEAPYYQCSVCERYGRRKLRHICGTRGAAIGEIMEVSVTQVKQLFPVKKSTYKPVGGRNDLPVDTKFPHTKKEEW